MPSCHDFIISWGYSIIVSWYYSVMVSFCHDLKVLSCHDFRLSCVMLSWERHCLHDWLRQRQTEGWQIVCVTPSPTLNLKGRTKTTFKCIWVNLHSHIYDIFYLWQSHFYFWQFKIVTVYCMTNFMWNIIVFIFSNQDISLFWYSCLRLFIFTIIIHTDKNASYL